MAINWQEVITTLGAIGIGGTGCVAAVAWLARTLITDGLARNQAEFGLKLKADADREIERFKNSLERAALEHQVRFSNLHQKRAEIIADLYKRLAEIERKAEYFVNQIGEERTKEGPTTLEQVWEFINFVDELQIYFPDEISRLLESYYMELKKHVVHAQVYGPIREYHDQTRTKREEGFADAFKAFSSQIPAIRKALREEFRAILGVN